ncbi:hypothetical protein Ahy_A07g033675 [Arachis hypogaea]|uniref:Uncharacterized protein n=1 Tax=Arachis hypogaea TaxID=3818 RepID=A0A445C9W4_ARAHY|nr:hypothetical protein Ahy_A07g033675 [Arachis hypogaea]
MGDSWRLQQMLEDVHEGQDHLTIWLRLKIKKAMLVHWKTEEGFRHQHLTNRANRTSARSSKYTSGSGTFMKTKAKLSTSLDREATLAETFKYTHTVKENKARFADQGSQDHYRLEAPTQQSQQSGEDADGSAASVIDPNAVWHETTSAPYKNRVYGLDSFFVSSLRTSTLRPSSISATSRAVEPEEGVDLRLQVHELTRSLQQQAQELNDYRERYQEILTRVTNTDDLRPE